MSPGLIVPTPSPGARVTHSAARLLLVGGLLFRCKDNEGFYYDTYYAGSTYRIYEAIAAEGYLVMVRHFPAQFPPF